MFDWDEHNIDHIAKHGFTPEDAEEALTDPDRVRSKAFRVNREKRFAIVGQTLSGQIIKVIYTKRGGKFRVVTVTRATDHQKASYRRHRR